MSSELLGSFHILVRRVLGTFSVTESSLVLLVSHCTVTVHTLHSMKRVKQHRRHLPFPPKVYYSLGDVADLQLQVVGSFDHGEPLPRSPHLHT